MTGTPTVIDAPAASLSSRRRRIWELDGHAHCPVIGTCLPVPLLRKLAAKVLGGEAIGSDYELHCGAVTDCKTRTRLAEAVQRALDQRFATALRASAGCKTPEALALWWRQTAAGAGLPGALWAVVTHPRCLPVVEQCVLGEVHMLQHQVGHADRADHARLAELQARLALATATVDSTRRRLATQATEHLAERDRLAAETVRLRGHLLARDALVLQLQEALAESRAAAPDLPTRRALEQRLRDQVERAQGLQRALNQARLSPVALPPSAPVATAPAAGRSALSQPAPLGQVIPGQPLADRTVLYVGGRTATVPVYRRLIEAAGGRFLHHDGGAEDNVQRLESTLSAAEVVICQTGCISHDAYWRVKDHCKRHGKRCVFVDKPSASMLQRALGQPLPEGPSHG